MKTLVRIALIHVGFAVILAGSACDPTVKQTPTTTSFVTTLPAAYAALKVTVREGSSEIDKKFAVSVGTYKDVTSSTVDRSFNYFVARNDQRGSTEGPGDSGNEPILGGEALPNGLSLRGNMIGFFFGGWGRIRNDHITTAISEMLAKTKLESSDPVPFGIYPVPVPMGGTLKAKYVIITFEGAPRWIATFLNKAENDSRDMQPMQWIKVEVDANDIVTFVGTPIPYKADESDLNDPEALEAIRVIGAIRKRLGL